MQIQEQTTHHLSLFIVLVVHRIVMLLLYCGIAPVNFLSDISIILVWTKICDASFPMRVVKLHEIENSREIDTEKVIVVGEDTMFCCSYIFVCLILSEFNVNEESYIT